MPSVQRSSSRARSRRGASSPAGFRFDAVAHKYYDGAGVIRPSITQMLNFCGYVDPRWFTEESRVRGHAVHRDTAEWDLGALDLKTCTSPYKGWLLAHIDAMRELGFRATFIEQARYSPRYQFGGRPDRVGTMDGARTIIDLKSGAKEDWHRIQTMMQAILEAAQPGALPAKYWKRAALYLREDGSWRLDPHEDTDRDYDEAMGVIADVCGVAA